MNSFYHLAARIALTLETLGYTQAEASNRGFEIAMKALDASIAKLEAELAA